MKLSSLQIPSPVHQIMDDRLLQKSITVLVKRDDLIHPQVQGNKWRKLKYNVLTARQQGFRQLLTFGGAFSNHIYAVAAAGQLFGFSTIGIIRGERPESLNPTLQFATDAGMTLQFISRTEYRQKTEDFFIKKLNKQFGNFYLIPEGGTNSLALQGVAEMVAEVQQQLPLLPDFWIAACGTGGTLTGMIDALAGRKQVVGVAVLKGDFHQKEISQLLKIKTRSTKNIPANWEVRTNYHFGGYAKFTDELVGFINDFKKQHQIQLDPVYTGKLFYALFDLIKKDYFPSGSRILAVHSGGLQGIAGFNQRFGNIISTI